MKPNAVKIKKLMKQFPFVQSVLDMWLIPLDGDGPDHRRVDDISITVQKADGDLMYRTGENVGLYGNDCIFSTAASHRNQVMRRGEYLFAVNAEDQIINKLVWPIRESREKPIYAWEVLYLSKVWMAGTNNYVHTAHIHDDVEYLVWVTIEGWHQYTENLDKPFGDFVSRNVAITIYGKPDIGFRRLEREADVYDNLYLNSQIFIRGFLNNDIEIISISARLDELCLSFQNQVYFQGMKQVLDKGKYRGASGTFGSVKVLAGELCGYDRVMLEDSQSWISFQLRPGSSTLYVLGMGGTLPQIRNLVNTIIKIWTEQHEVRQQFKSDKEVQIL